MSRLFKKYLTDGELISYVSVANKVRLHVRVAKKSLGLIIRFA